MKVFLDTNVLVSAFTARGLCADLMRTILAEHELVTAEAVLAELQDVLRRRFDYAPQTIEAVTGLLREYPVQPIPEHLPEIHVRDPDDLIVLASAIAADADVLVTGDEDLLSARDDSPVVITDPRGFLRMLRGE